MSTPAEKITTELTDTAQQVMTQAEQALEKAQAMTVTDDEQYSVAGNLIADMKRHKTKLETERKELKAPILEAGKTIDRKFRPHLDNIDKAIKAANGKMTAYYREQEERRRKAEAEAAEKARKERERLEKRAEQAEAKGREEKADLLREQAGSVTAPVSESAPRQTQETTIVETWHAEVFDKLSLIEAVAAGKASMEYLDVNMPALHARARAEKDTFQVPGVRAVKEQSVRRK